MSNTEELAKKKSHALLSGVVESFTEIDIPDLGVGRMTTTATVIMTTLMIEDNIMDRATVINRPFFFYFLSEGKIR